MTTTETPTPAEGQSVNERTVAPFPFAEKDHGLCIAVLDRGFVYVGRCRTTTSIAGTWLTIDGARCVRRWGTKHGLMQLANEGPQPETVLDASGEVQAPLRALVHLLPCAEARWA